MSEKSAHCWRCGTPLVSGASFCKRCGANVEDQEPTKQDMQKDMKIQYCSRCGKKVSPRAAFCSNCGLELARPETTLSPILEPDMAAKESIPPTWPAPREYPYPSMPTDRDRSLSLIEGVIVAICSFPFYAIPGIVAWAAWRGKYPRRARQAFLVGALAFAVNVILVIYIIKYRPYLIPEDLRRMLEQP
ncbi:MAG: zinc ribbon domain-containing protein [Candidatus Heimdallarchaeota archaeon]